MLRSLAPSLLLAGLPALLVTLAAIPFVSVEVAVLASVIAYVLVLATELPVHVFLYKAHLPLTLGLHLLAVCARLLFAVIFVVLAASHYTEAFILIFCVSLSLTIMFDSVLMMKRSQEPVHA